MKLYKARIKILTSATMPDYDEVIIPVEENSSESSVEYINKLEDNLFETKDIGDDAIATTTYDIDETSLLSIEFKDATIKFKDKVEEEFNDFVLRLLKSKDNVFKFKNKLERKSSILLYYKNSKDCLLEYSYNEDNEIECRYIAYWLNHKNVLKDTLEIAEDVGADFYTLKSRDNEKYIELLNTFVKKHILETSKKDSF